MNNTDIRICIEEVIEKYCDGTFINGLQSARFVEAKSPAACSSELFAAVIGILEDEERPIIAERDEARRWAIKMRDERDEARAVCTELESSIFTASKHGLTFHLREDGAYDMMTPSGHAFYPFDWKGS